MATRRRRSPRAPYTPQHDGTSREYADWQAFVNDCKREPVTRSKSSRRPVDDYAGFDQGGTFEEALVLADGGWSEGWERVADMTATLERVIMRDVEQPVIAFDVTGDYIDVGTYMTGEPECCGYFDTEPIARPIVHIVFNMTVSAGIGTDVIERRGFGVLALINALEKSGRRCEVTACAMSGSSQPLFVTIKRPNELLNTGLTAFALCHPAMLRRLVFGWWDGEGHNERGYGSPKEAHESKRGDLYLKSGLLGESQWNDDAATQAWVMAELQRQGVTMR